MKKLPCFVGGSDVRADAVAHAQSNARAAGIGHLLSFERRDVADFHPPDGPPGVMICNPPYGERIGDERELRGFYRRVGEVLAERCHGWQCVVFTANDAPWREIAMKPASVMPFWNGRIACRLLKYTPA